MWDMTRPDYNLKKLTTTLWSRWGHLKAIGTNFTFFSESFDYFHSILRETVEAGCHNNANTSWRSCKPACLPQSSTRNPQTHLLTSPQPLPARKSTRLPALSQAPPCSKSLLSHVTCWWGRMCASWQQVCDWAAQVRAQEKPAAAACWGAPPPAHRPDDSSTHFSPYFAKKCSYVMADVSGCPLLHRGT